MGRGKRESVKWSEIKIAKDMEGGLAGGTDMGEPLEERNTVE